MPDTYQPSDEQIQALCTAEAALYVGDEDHLATKAFVRHPAFQSIIRAARAEALRRFIERRPNPARPGTHRGTDQAMYSSSQIDEWIESADA